MVQDELEGKLSSADWPGKQHRHIGHNGKNLNGFPKRNTEEIISLAQEA